MYEKKIEEKCFEKINVNLYLHAAKILVIAK